MKNYGGTHRSVSFDKRPLVMTLMSAKNAVFWMISRVVLVRTDVSEELSAAIIRVSIIGELGTTLAVTSNQHMLRSISDDGGTKFLQNVGSYKSHMA
jgi:hypothetical protein